MVGLRPRSALHGANTCMRTSNVARRSCSEGSVESGALKTACFGEYASELQYHVILPPGYDRAERLPLLLNLHSAAGSSAQLATSRPLYEAHWQKGEMPRCVVAGFSTLAGRGYYMDYFDGSLNYMKFFLEDWLPFLRSHYGVGAEQRHTWLTGASMGGCGALRIAFTLPSTFGGVAAFEPAIDPVFESEDILPRNLMGRGDYDFSDGGLPPPEEDPHGSPQADWRAAFGSLDHRTWDRENYQRYNPASVARNNAQNIRESGLRIYIDCADEDMFCLQDGAAFLHHTLWQHRIRHEFHLVTEADHLGSTFLPRQMEINRWLGRMMKSALRPRKKELTAGQRKFVEFLEKEGAFMPTPEMYERMPAGAEPIGPLDDAMAYYMREKFPSFMREHMDKATDGWNRFEEDVIQKRRL